MIDSICFHVTYNCNALCDYCQCGPDQKEHLTFEDMKNYIDEAMSLKPIRLVVFTGGEPTLIGADLAKTIEYAHSKGLYSRFVTNAFWGKTLEKAKAYLSDLKSRGEFEINISVDDLHQEWVNLEFVKNVFMACQDLNIPCLIATKVDKKSKITKEYLENYFGVELIHYKSDIEYTEDERKRLISTGTIVPVGRQPPPDKYDLIYGGIQTNCSAILKDLIINPHHEMIACCGIVSKNIPDLVLGNLKQDNMISIIEKANSDLFLNWICLEGPFGIKQFIEKESEGQLKFSCDYVNMCHLCDEILTRKEIRDFIRTNIEKIKDRVSMHRNYFEAIRENSDQVEIYCERKS